MIRWVVLALIKSKGFLQHTDVSVGPQRTFILQISVKLNNGSTMFQGQLRGGGGLNVIALTKRHGDQRHMSEEL